MKRKKI